MELLLQKKRVFFVREPLRLEVAFRAILNSSHPDSSRSQLGSSDSR